MNPEATRKNCRECFHQEKHHSPGCRDGGWVFERDESGNVARMLWSWCRCPAFVRSPRDITLDDHLAYVDSVDASLARAVSSDPEAPKQATNGI